LVEALSNTEHEWGQASAVWQGGWSLTRAVNGGASLCQDLDDLQLVGLHQERGAPFLLSCVT
jgi:hypothetical protein